MADTDADRLQALSRDEIHSETSKIAWSELQRFFAAGRAINVSPDLDLVEVALQVSNDNSDLVREWMDKGKLAPVLVIRAESLSNRKFARSTPSFSKIYSSEASHSRVSSALVSSSPAFAIISCLRLRNLKQMLPL